MSRQQRNKPTEGVQFTTCVFIGMIGILSGAVFIAALVNVQRTPGAYEQRFCGGYRAVFVFHHNYTKYVICEDNSQNLEIREVSRQDVSEYE